MLPRCCRLLQMSARWMLCWPLYAALGADASWEPVPPSVDSLDSFQRGVSFGLGGTAYATSVVAGAAFVPFACEQRCKQQVRLPSASVSISKSNWQTQGRWLWQLNSGQLTAREAEPSFAPLPHLTYADAEMVSLTCFRNSVMMSQMLEVAVEELLS